MAKEIMRSQGGSVSPFERIKRTNEAGAEYWSSRDFSATLSYGDYRNLEGVIEKAKTACVNSGHRIEDHFGDVTEMVVIGSGAERSVKSVQYIHDQKCDDDDIQGIKKVYQHYHHEARALCFAKA